jgi:glutamyl-tRNA synthetase
MTVRTRFAPSPTGYLHIGGARTALFNWLLARRHGGRFILRIDDTDEARHVDEAVALILHGFRWLGLDWDEGPEVGGPYGPYFQSQRGEQYQAALESLIERGFAYPDATPPEELDVQRRAAEAAKRPFVFRGKDRAMDPAQAIEIFRRDKPAVRFRVPEGRTTVLEDKVRGRVEWRTDLLGDFSIARTGGKPLYNLASVVDDVAMRITHVVRAEEHLSNTHPQLLLFEALEAARPEFAHLPYVAAPGSKKKLSKRNPPPGVMVALEEYERAGYLPQAVLNALVRLGWSLDDKTELMELSTMIENFSLDRVTAAPAALDPDKLFWMQDHYMRRLSTDERVERMLPFLQEKGLAASPPTDEQRRIVATIDLACGERLKLLSDVVRYGEFALVDDVVYDKEAAKHLGKEGAAEILRAARAALAKLEPFTVTAIEYVVAEVREATGAGGRINHVLRAAATGRSVGPGIFDCLAILGREKTLARIDQALEAIASGALARPPGGGG